MKFEPRTVSDFLKHEYFVQWVHTPTPISDQYWKRWLSQHPEHIALLHVAKDLMLSYNYKQTHSMNDVAYYTILDKLLEENNQQRAEEGIRRPSDHASSWFYAAASILFFLSVVFLGLFYFGRSKTQPMAKVINYATESVPKGFKKTIILPDGSSVKLNSLSDLRYPAEFSDTLREVYLNGQAFFEVTKNPKAPFLVHTQHFTTRVIGTSFDIRAYATESNSHVAVLTGKVKVEAVSGQQEILKPRDITTYNEATNALKKSVFNPNDLLAWRDGVIVFDKASFTEITTCLSRWYGVEFEIEKGFEVKGHYTGRFNKEALTTVLKGIAYASHFTFQVEDNKVFIHKP